MRFGPGPNAASRGGYAPCWWNALDPTGCRCCQHQRCTSQCVLLTRHIIRFGCSHLRCTRDLVNLVDIAVVPRNADGSIVTSGVHDLGAGDTIRRW